MHIYKMHTRIFCMGGALILIVGPCRTATVCCELRQHAYTDPITCVHAGRTAMDWALYENMTDAMEVCMYVIHVCVRMCVYMYVYLIHMKV